FGDATPTVGVVVGVGLTNRWGRPTPHYPIEPIPNSPPQGTSLMERLKAGTLPEMSFVDPDTIHENSDGQDEHPPADIQIGQKWMSDLVHAVMASPQWAHIALFITWDEHGGFYDHLPPPPACVPDNKAPILDGPNNSMSYPFDHYGIRVPLIVVSPYAKKAYASHN